MPAFSRRFRPILCLAVTLLLGCSRNPFEREEAKSGKKGGEEDSTYILAQKVARAAADMHQEVAADERTRQALAAAAEDTVRPETGVRSIGPPKGDPTLSHGTTPRSHLANALLKRAGATFASASALFALPRMPGPADSTRLVLDDSARGYVHTLRDYTFRDTAADGAVASGEARDSTVLRWPLGKDQPVVLSFHRVRRHGDGTVETASAFDADGDGLLAESKAGARVRLRREWARARGDTVRKAWALTDHGATTWFDSLGAGRAETWSDTLQVGGKTAWWRKVYDRDGDGYVHTAAAGVAQRVGLDSYAVLGDAGLHRFATEVHGPGPDGDYGRDADNEHVAASAYMVNDRGEDVSRTASGDADGDGLLWSPVPGAANRVWESTVWTRRAGYRAFRDSVVKALGQGRDADAEVIHYAAAYVEEDGDAGTLSIAAAQGASFGADDTARVAELLLPAAGDAERRDSVVREARIIPGRLDDEADDRLVAWSVRTHYGPASKVASRLEAFTAAAPVFRGAEAEAGSHILEERLHAAGPRDLARLWRRRDFDRKAGTSTWKEVRAYRDGDSAVASGRRLADGGAVYIAQAGTGVKVSGWHDPATGAFRDTVAWLDADGKPAGVRTAAGTEAGGADTTTAGYTARIERRDGRAVVFQVASERLPEGARAFTRLHDGDTAYMVMKGDTATMEKGFGRATVSFVLARGGEAEWRLSLSGVEAGGAKVLEGTAVFGGGGAGEGELVMHAGGNPQKAMVFRAAPDGSVELDGVKLPR